MKAKNSLLTVVAGLAAGAAALFFSKEENRTKAIKAGKRASAVVTKKAKAVAKKAQAVAKKPAVKKAVKSAKKVVAKKAAKKKGRR